jgi:two-component sensor histidine kinase
LAPRTAVALSMALHELATNALKFGALSVPAGQVSITWGIAQGPAPRFRLSWTERGGPAVALPTRRGFGTRMVERSLAQDLGGTVRIEFAPDGVVCRMDAPLAVVAAPAGVVPLVSVGQSRGG